MKRRRQGKTVVSKATRVHIPDDDDEPPQQASNVTSDSARLVSLHVTREGFIGQRVRFRPFDEVIAVRNEGPSRALALADAGSVDDSIQVDPDPGDSHIRMDGQSGSDATPSVEKEKRQRTRAMDDWLPYRSSYVDELIRIDGRGWNSLLVCSICKESSVGSFRCLDCFGSPMVCKDCLLKLHSVAPLHRIETWDGGFWRRTSLAAIGLQVSLGHSGFDCASPSGSTCMTVVHVNGVHSVNVLFCGCGADITGHARYIQLLRNRWYPATQTQPATAFSMDVLDLFHELTVQGKIAAHDFYTALTRLSNPDAKLNRYAEFLRASRTFRHVIMVKRAGRGHDPAGVDATGPGELALDCPACPHPGKNLPVDWESMPNEKKFLYILFSALDANFRLKLKDRGVKGDYELGPGWGYFVNNDTYSEEIPKHTETVEKSSCESTHQALARATSRVNKGYSVTGVGAVVCSRSGIVRGNGVADLQKGERYVNMNYIFLSSLIGIAVAWIFVSYDVACQWSKKLHERIRKFPTWMQLDLSRIKVVTGVPKFHLAAHGDTCRTLFSLNFRRFWGRTDGEGIERSWAHINPVAMSTREMGPGFRHDTIDSHWSAWNWRIIIGLGNSLYRKLEEAISYSVKQAETLKAFSESFSQETLQEWTDDIIVWQEDPMGKADPFSEPPSSKTMAEVRSELSLEERLIEDESDPDIGETSPTAFLCFGLKIEEQQRAIKLALELLKTGNRKLQASKLVGKRNILYSRIKKYRRQRSHFMPRAQSSASNASPEDDECERDRPELIPLHLPSSMSISERASLDPLHGLIEKESRLREALGEDYILKMRNLLRVRTSVYKQKKSVAVGQRENTRANALLTGFNDKIKRIADVYRANRTALESLDPNGAWTARLLPLDSEDLKGPDGTDETRPLLRRDPRNMVSEGRREFSWIWLNPGSRASQSETTSSFSTNDGNVTGVVGTMADGTRPDADTSVTLKVEWSKAYARAERWQEEVQLVSEEMRRTLAYCEWKDGWWREQATRRHDTSPDLDDGLVAYAQKQASIWDGLGATFAKQWAPLLRKHNMACEWPARYLSPLAPPNPISSQVQTIPTSFQSSNFQDMDTDVDVPPPRDNTTHRSLEGDNYDSDDLDIDDLGIENDGSAVDNDRD